MKNYYSYNQKQFTFEINVYKEFVITLIFIMLSENNNTKLNIIHSYNYVKNMEQKTGNTFQSGNPSLLVVRPQVSDSFFFLLYYIFCAFLK